jgi:antitoxin MazE
VTTTVAKWGNSQGIRLPKVFLRSINIAENDRLDILLQDNAIVLKKAVPRAHKTTKERIADFAGKSVEAQQEIEWGKPAGDEIW